MLLFQTPMDFIRNWNQKVIILIYAGDFAAIMEIDAWIFWNGSRPRTSTKIFISGNHDFIAADSPEEFESKIPPGIIYLNDSGVEINGLNFWGSPVQPGLVGWAFGKRRGEEIKKHWDIIPPDVDVLITHTPPCGILDESTSFQSLGCEQLSERLFFLSPFVHIFGHVHASYGLEKHNGIVYINGSNVETDGGLVNEPIVFDLDREGRFTFIAPG
ncbi:MAG: metallophosphoesterase [Bacteroidia bacterium]